MARMPSVIKPGPPEDHGGTRGQNDTPEKLEAISPEELSCIHNYSMDFLSDDVDRGDNVECCCVEAWKETSSGLS